jgi:hypothetical protein
MTVFRSLIFLLAAVFVFGCTAVENLEVPSIKVPNIQVVENDDPVYKKITDGKTSTINPEIPGLPKYRTFYTGTTGFVPEETIRRDALKEVESFCTQSGKRPYLIEETMSSPPYILGNWQRIEILFSCVENTR